MSLLFPARCMFCGEPVTEKQCYLCNDCRISAEQEIKTLACRPPEHVDRLICAGRYQGSYRGALLRVKYANRPSALYPIAGLMARAWEIWDMPQPELVTCVPMHPWRQSRRGFNQSEELARMLAENWRAPFANVLMRSVFSKKQSRLDAEARRENAETSFAPAKRAVLRAKTILLVDDIVTTGSTTSACAKILREMGAETVWVLAAAKA